MDELGRLLKDMINERLVQVTLSNSRNPAWGDKLKLRPVLLQNKLMFQSTRYTGPQVFHQNHTPEEAGRLIEDMLRTQFRQCEMTARDRSATVLVSKKGKMTVKVRQAVCDIPTELSHNREKQYILKEGEPVDFLVGLGVQTPEGRVARNKYDKFRQINRYLEFIEDILDQLPSRETIHVVDFGCGKSYLTFAMYYYLHVLQGRDICVTGLDLKEDVIRRCNDLAGQCGYEKLRFQVGDISTYEGMERVDMVVSLHACDTATDYALEKAVRWGAKVILAVPCCQHEVNRQIHCAKLSPILRYGVIRERMSALITDAVRANLLEQQGYDTQILEFIDMEHTPKNLLIRAVRRTAKNACPGGGQPRMQKRQAAAMQEASLAEVLELLGIEPKLASLLGVRD
ncbi:MAG: SAM-dependent methyltransferase [bacterium]|nr:SAM-dependent methyltransferase [bacterium]MCM1375305.1 SAM-dependent methyltransferase [Muribaculum sp.]MCM1409778.1 SAM-dependent methyltransferase [Lachnospiraceae bacterium]